MSPRGWEIFPRQRWPRHFGLREPPARVVPEDLDQLELSWELVLAQPRELSVRDRLREIFERTRWPQYDFARLVLGCHERTLQRYLSGGRIPEDRGNWVRRLESVVLHGDRVLVVVHAGQFRGRR